MHLVVIGLNHKTAPVEVREKVAVAEHNLQRALEALRLCGCVAECCILSTCNRTEAYAVVDKRENEEVLVEYLSRRSGVEASDLRPHLYALSGRDCIQHLFSVAAGLDSMMLGEHQILGQVKTAFCAAGDAACTGTILNSLFRQAVTVGKRARTETEISRGAFSVGRAAVELATSIFGDLSGRKVLILGAGKMSELTATHLVSSGASSIIVSNRTRDRAEELAARLGGTAIGFDNFAGAICEADIVIGSTASPHPVVTREQMQKTMKQRYERPIFLIDIAVPRDFESGIGNLDNVFLYNIDDLQSLVQQSSAEREREIEKVNVIISEEVRAFMTWLKTLEVVPLIKLLREKLESVKEGEWERNSSRFAHLPEADREAIRALLKSVVSKLSHYPVLKMKEYAADSNGYGKLDLVRELFGIRLEDLDKAELDGKEP